MPAEPSVDTARHALRQFVQQAGEEMAAEYRRIADQAQQDPGTAGDEGEENWAQLLREWLPTSYFVTTKGRILSEQGQLSRQVDVVVLSPAYPRALLSKKTYLAGGVVAAFECKLTLRPEHVAAAVAKAADIRRILFVRGGTPYRELFSPLICGLLAHSHRWKRSEATPIANIDRGLQDADAKSVQHPREMLDLVCVADLATWWATKISPGRPPVPIEIPGFAGSLVSSGYAGPNSDIVEGNTPIGVFLTQLTRRMAWEDPSLRPIAEYWKWTGMGGGFSASGRQWRIEKVYSPRVLRGLDEHSARPDEWNEWQSFLF
ncbi:MAG: hypothetical protein M3256_18240 [Actinomycetota bacterium]|nr:hypothetical protein [Actinomycetota bacterium]